MLVVYKGHIPTFIYEFNSKRYLFSNKQNVVDMPPDALRHLYSSRTPNAMDIIPVEAEDVSKLKTRIEELEGLNNKLNEETKGLEAKLKKALKKK